MDSVVAPARSAALAAVFKPVHPPTTFEETVERLGTAIRLGLLAPGSRLPPERALAEELRIPRSTLRQALLTLVQSGHLVALRGRAGGTFVADSPTLSEAGAGVLEPEARGCSTTAWRSRPARRSSRPSGRRPRTSRASRRTPSG